MLLFIISREIVTMVKVFSEITVSSEKHTAKNPAIICMITYIGTNNDNFQYYILQNILQYIIPNMDQEYPETGYHKIFAIRILYITIYNPLYDCV